MRIKSTKKKIQTKNWLLAVAPQTEWSDHQRTAGSDNASVIHAAAGNINMYTVFSASFAGNVSTAGGKCGHQR